MTDLIKGPLTWPVLLFGIGFLFKVLHWPLSAFLMIVAVVAMVVRVVRSSVRSPRPDPLIIGAWAALVVWFIYLLFRLQFWQGSSFVYLLAPALSLLVLMGLATRKGVLGTGLVVCLVLWTVGGTLLYFVPAYRLYGWVNMLRAPLPTDPYTWDKYSWFLYQGGSRHEALAASDSALAAARRGLEYGLPSEVTEDLEQHRLHIIGDTWASYSRPGTEREE